MNALIAMSGGVDSSVAAKLMVDAGYTCAGCMMKLYANEDAGLSRAQTCCSLDDVEDARAVAYKLGIPFYVFNFQSEFREQVIQKFVCSYESGRTPNPCIDCNRYLKFGKLYERARVLGFDCIVTGHYARITHDGRRYLLQKALDPEKDQSYVLYGMTQELLAHTRFPLGTFQKAQTREIAEKSGFLNAKKRDSQDICFVPDGKYADFIERTTGQPSVPGPFVDQEGRVLGLHKGIIRYTKGQHKRLGLSTEQPLYVLEKDIASNTIRLGPDSALWSHTLTAERMNWISVPELDGPMAVTVKTRYTQREAAAVAEPLAGGRIRVTFEEPQRAITAGQAVVLYDDDTVVGGGTICGT